MPLKMKKSQSSPLREIGSAPVADAADANTNQNNDSSLFGKVKKGTKFALLFSAYCISQVGSMIFKKKTVKNLDMQRLTTRQRLNLQAKEIRLKEAKKLKAHLDSELAIIQAKVDAQATAVEEAEEELEQEKEDLAHEQDVITIGGAVLPSLTGAALCVGAGAVIGMHPQATAEIAKEAAVYVLQAGLEFVRSA